MTEKQPTLEELKEGQSVELPLMLLEKEIRQSKNGARYLYMNLRDATGTITAFMWDQFDETARQIEQGDLLKIKARTQVYRNSMQLIVNRVTVLEDEEYSKQHFMPSSDADPEALMTRFQAIIDSMEDEKLKALLNEIFGDPEVLKAFKQAPAAKALHHSYIGGLLEHTLSIMELGIKLCEIYTHLDRDLLITGSALHDIGKIRELSSEGWLDYSREGRLIGHITLGVRMVEEFIQRVPDFPENLREHIIHMILSHHGMYEYGSPRRPKTREALTLHFLDNLDSHLQGFEQALKDQRDETAYCRILERFIYNS